MEWDKGGEEIHICPFKSFLQMFFFPLLDPYSLQIWSLGWGFLEFIWINQIHPLHQQSPAQLTHSMKNGQKGSSRRPFKKFNWRLSYPSEICFRAHWEDQHLGLGVGIQIGSLCVALKMPAVVTIHGVLGYGLGLRVASGLLRVPQPSTFPPRTPSWLPEWHPSELSPWARQSPC